jgi:hypothetical protein
MARRLIRVGCCGWPVARALYRSGSRWGKADPRARRALIRWIASWCWIPIAGRYPT